MEASECYNEQSECWWKYTRVFGIHEGYPSSPPASYARQALSVLLPTICTILKRHTLARLPIVSGTACDQTYISSSQRMIGVVAPTDEIWREILCVREADAVRWSC